MVIVIIKEKSYLGAKVMASKELGIIKDTKYFV